MLVLSSFTIRSTLPSWSERAAVSENDDGVPRQGHTVERRHTSEIQEESEISAEVGLGREPANRSSKHRTDSPEMLRMRTVEIFKVSSHVDSAKLEDLQITINYLQAMAIALGLKVKWNKSLVKAFSVAGEMLFCAVVDHRVRV